MKYYKIVNPKGHKGLIYHEGLNIDPLEFNPSGNCEAGGIYFSREDIFVFLKYGTELYEVEPVGEVYENPGYPKKWKSHTVKLKHLGKVFDNIEVLTEQFENANVYLLLQYAAEIGNLDAVKYLVEHDVDIHANYDEPSSWAASNGHLDVVKYLVEHNVDIHANEDCALRCAASNGHLDVVKYLVDLGADIHANEDCALCLAAYYGHLDVVKYLVDKGADIHVRNDDALRCAINNGHTEVVEYLKSLN